MSRIYQSEGAKARYSGADKSVKYNPVQAVSDTKQLKEYKQAVLADNQTLGRELTRQQQQERMSLEAQQRADASSLRKQGQKEVDSLRASQLYETKTLEGQQLHEKLVMGLEASQQKYSAQAQNAKTALIGKSIQGLLSFGGSVLEYQGQQAKIDEQNMLFAADMEAAGLGGSFGSENPISEDKIEASANTSLIAQADSTATNNATADLVTSSNPSDNNAANTARQQTLWKQLEPLRGMGYSAAAGYPAALQEAYASGLIRPGAQGLVDAQEFTRKYAQATGVLNGVPRELQAKFARTAAAANQNVVTAATTAHVTEVKKANKITWEANVSSIVDSSNSSTIGQAFNQANAELIHGNVGYHGKNSAAATAETLKQVLEELKIEGRTADIRALRDHIPNPATGLTLGSQHDNMFDAAERESRQASISNFNLQENEQQLQIKQTVELFNNDPTPANRQQVINQLREMGTAESLAEANRLMEKGMNYDPQVKFDLAQRRQAGIPISQQELKSLADRGVITADEYKEFALSDAQLESGKKVDSFLKGVSAGYKQSMMGKFGPTDLPAPVKAQLQTRHARFMGELGDLVKAEIAANPGLADDSAELSRIVEQKASHLLQQPHYQIQQNPGRGPSFAGGIDPDRKIQLITTAGGMQDFSALAPEEVFSGNLPKSEMQPGKDLFLTLDQLKAESKLLLEGGTPSNRTRLIAKNLGLSSRALVEAQLRVNGLPSLKFMEQNEASTVTPISGGQDFDKHSGMKALKTMGVPHRGAAYLSANIESESGWWGMRSWGEVAGDGTNRNGGLVSWASWSHDSARLGRIERRYGKPIEHITEAEQLNYMMEEMKTSYPSAYRAFMNPNSSDSDLRAASYAYWGYGIEGDRYTIARQLL